MKRLLKGLVYVYRYVFKALIPQKCCRFTPSCSQYALDALEEYGACKGVGLTLKRLLRCHPWGGHGYDPIPKQKD